MNRQIGVGDSEYVIVFDPPTHGSRDSAHAQWPRTHSPVFKLGSKVGHVTRHTQQLFKVKRSEVKVTKSRDVSADKNAITRQCMVISTSNLVGIIDVWYNFNVSRSNKAR